MAFTKINAAGIGTTETVTVDGLTVINDGSFGGNLTVSGVLTYEDVTNVDSVGLITARNGIVVGSGITLSKDGDVFFTGIATGNGSGLTALNASNLASGTVPTARLGSGTASSSTFLRGDSTFAAVTSTTINNNADNRLITGSGTANTLEAEANITFDGTSLNLLDHKNIYLGTGNDLRIWHDANNSYSQISGQNHSLYIDGATTYMRTSDGSSGVENAIVMNSNGSVDLYHSGTKMLYTHSTGAIVKRPSGGETELTIYGCEGNDAHLLLAADDGDDNADYWRFLGGTAGQLDVANYSTGSWVNHMTIDGNGVMTRPKTPSFSAHTTATASADAEVVFGAAVTAIGSDYSTSTGRFTAPVAGNYYFSFHGMGPFANSSNARCHFRINGAVHGGGQHYGGVAYSGDTGDYTHVSMDTILPLSANDYVTVYWEYMPLHAEHNKFNGFLIG